MFAEDHRATKHFSAKQNKMKTKRTQRYAGPNLQGKGIDAGYKATPSQDKSTSVVSSRAHIKPFAGKVFYLDLPSNKITETLERDIRELGGTVEKFFSKEIKYLVSNKREAKYVQCLRQNSPVPSPDSGQSSPHPRSNPHQPGSHRDGVNSRSRDQTEMFVPSRGKSLVERVVKDQELIQINKILSNAQEWGVKILYIDDIMAYLKRKKRVVSSQCPAATAVKINVKAESAAKQGSQKCKGGRISKPYVKVEDSSRHYRPIYLTMPNLPQFNMKTIPPCSPFFVEDKDLPGNKQRGQRGLKASASEERAHGRKKNRDKKGGGYCECCTIKYDNITMHLQSACHQAFSKSDNYLVLDKLISAMHCNFVNIRAEDKRPKCSESSVVAAPGPCVKAELRHRGHPGPTEINKEQQRTLNGHKGFCSGQTANIGSVPTSAALVHREEDRRSADDMCSDRSKRKYLGRQQLCRQNSTSCSQKDSGSKMETAPPRGGVHGSSPCRDERVDSVDQIISEHKNSSAFHTHTVNREKHVSSETHDVIRSHHQEGPDVKQDSSVLESLQDNIAGNDLSENGITSSPPQNISPARKIQRRVRVSKRKRQKVDTQVERVKQSDIPDNSRLTFSKLFQSSEDMDVEFLGFDDRSGNKMS